MIPLITIEGPTASGKSALALELAQSLNTGIISADSRQIYRYLDIGTAKPSIEQQQSIPHHLIDIINPDKSYDAGSFARDASRRITDYHERGLIPIVCGGTGLYIKALLEGVCELPPIPKSIKKELKAELDAAGEDIPKRQLVLAELYSRLKEVDADFAFRISANDPQRIIRGLEVYLATGVPLSVHWRNQQSAQDMKAFRILILPPRDQLYAKINSRFDEMLAKGLIDEIKAVLDRGYSWQDAGLNSLGYKEFQDFLEGRIKLDEAKELAAQHTRNYAKRQTTWYRKIEFDLTSEDKGLNISVLRTRLSLHR